MPFRNQNFNTKWQPNSFGFYRPFQDEKFGQDFGDNVRNRTHSSSGPRFFNDTPGDFRSANSRSASEPPEDRPMDTKSTSGANQTVKSHVRQIPIFVEGRDEPVLARDFTKEPTPEKQSNQNFPGTEYHMGNKVPTFARPSSFNKPQKDVEIKPEVIKSGSHNSAQRPQQQEQSGPAPMTQSEPQPQPQRQLDSIEKIQMIQKNVLNLINDVEQFRGDKNDKTYLYLDEMLTRNLLCLDNIDTEGKENIRKARKEAIKCIQSCINLLEKKATSGNDASRSMNEETAESADEPPNTEMRAVLVPKKEMDVSAQDENPQQSESYQQPMELETRAVLVSSNTCPLEENRAVLVEDEHAMTSPADVVVNAN